MSDVIGKVDLLTFTSFCGTTAQNYRPMLQVDSSTGATVAVLDADDADALIELLALWRFKQIFSHGDTVPEWLTLFMEGKEC